MSDLTRGAVTPAARAVDRTAPGVRDERKVPPGETPPGESSTGSETGPPIDLTRGWGTWPLVVIGVIGAVFAAFFLMYAILLVV